MNTSATGTQFTESFRDGALILELKGPIDSTLTLDSLISLVNARGVSDVVVVLDGVDYINSEGFGALIRFSDAVAGLQRSLYIVGLQAKVRVVFDTLGVGNLLNVLATVEDALDRIRSSRPLQFRRPDSN